MPLFLSIICSLGSDKIVSLHCDMTTHYFLKDLSVYKSPQNNEEKKAGLIRSYRGDRIDSTL